MMMMMMMMKVVQFHRETPLDCSFFYSEAYPLETLLALSA